MAEKLIVSSEIQTMLEKCKMFSVNRKQKEFCVLDVAAIWFGGEWKRMGWGSGGRRLMEAEGSVLVIQRLGSVYI
jgi:hypothetical protein